MAKYDQIRGFIRGISDEEFEILLNLAFTLIGFKTKKPKRSLLVTNDFLFVLTRIEKRFFRSEKEFVYVAYVDRKQHEYSSEWVSDFWSKANSFDTYLRNDVKKVFIMDMNKIQKIELAKDLKKHIQFKTGNKFFDYLFNRLPEDRSKIEHLYSNESQIWAEKTLEQQKDFCGRVGVDYKYQLLWQFDIDQQCKLIFSLQNNTEGKQKRREEKRTYSDSDLKKYYDVLEIPETASSTKVKNAYRVWIKIYHTDNYETKGSETREIAKKKLKEVIVAYEELKKVGKAA